MLFEINHIIPDGSYVYKWADSNEINENCRPYVDEAQRLGITSGIGNSRFDPKGIVDTTQLKSFIGKFDTLKASGTIKPQFDLWYEDSYCIPYGCATQKGLNMIPREIVDDLYDDGYSIKIVQDITPFFDNSPNFSNSIGVADHVNKEIFIEAPASNHTVVITSAVKPLALAMGSVKEWACGGWF